MQDVPKVTTALYLDSLAHRAPATRVEYRRELDYFWRTCRKQPGEVTTIDVEMHLHTRCAGKSASTRKMALAILSCFFVYMHQGGLITTNPVRPIVRPLIPEIEPTFWTAEEVRRILSAPMTPRDHLLLETFARTGQRSGVVHRLKWENVRLDLREPAIHFPGGKRGRLAVLPMDRELIHDFTVYKRMTHQAQSDWVFASRQRGGHLSTQRTNAIIEKACRLANVRVSTAHEFRRSRATNLLMAGVPLDVVSRDILLHAAAGRIEDAPRRARRA